MALGEQIGEVSGTITGTRVITPSAGQTRIEVSFQGSGTMLGQDITDIGTYWQTLRPGGVLYGEGDVLYITGDGQSAHWRGGVLVSVGPRAPSLRGISPFVVPLRPSRRRSAASTR